LGDRYDIRGYISHGGFASVWHVVDRTDGVELAVKRLRPNAVRTRDFYRELRATLNINHPNVVRLVNFLESGEERYLILELCRGGSLRQAISRGRTAGVFCPLPRLAEVISQLAAGLGVAHALGLTHRDLKPENVLFAESYDGPFGGKSTVKLADFGLASVRHTQDDGRLRAITGSPAYMAPEQFTGGFAPASDVYSLGVLAYELITGDVPFMGSPEDLAYQHLRGHPDWSKIENQAWRTLLQGMLNKAADARPTAQEVFDKLGGRKRRKARAVTNNILLKEHHTASTGVIGAGARGFLSWDHHTITRWNIAGENVACTTTMEGARVTVLADRDNGWIVADGHVDRWREPSPPVRLTPHAIPAAQVLPFEDQGIARAVVVDADRLELMDLSTGLGVWSRKNLNFGPKPLLTRMGDGTLACVTLVDRPYVAYFDAGGQHLGTHNLPGIAWQVAPLKRNIALRLLTGNGFRVFLANPQGAVLRLDKSEGVACFATTDDSVYGAWPDGRLKSWTHEGLLRESHKLPFAPGRIRGLAAAERTVAVLSEGAQGSALRFLQLAPRGE
jgi:hypothetical protein